MGGRREVTPSSRSPHWASGNPPRHTATAQQVPTPSHSSRLRLPHPPGDGKVTSPSPAEKSVLVYSQSCAAITLQLSFEHVTLHSRRPEGFYSLIHEQVCPHSSCVGEQGFSIKGQTVKYFWLCRPDSLCHNHSALPLQHENI